MNTRAFLYGTLFVFTTSLVLTNKALLEDKKMPKELYILNCLTMLASGSLLYVIF